MHSLKIINISQVSNIAESIASPKDSFKPSGASPFRPFLLRQKIEARPNSRAPESCENATEKNEANSRLNKEIDELIKKQKVSLMQSIGLAKSSTNVKRSTPAPHYKLKAAVFASGDTDGAEDEDCEDFLMTENIEEAPVLVIHPSSIRTGLAKSNTFSGKHLL